MLIKFYYKLEVLSTSPHSQVRGVVLTGELHHTLGMRGVVRTGGTSQRPLYPYREVVFRTHDFYKILPLAEIVWQRRI